MRVIGAVVIAAVVAFLATGCVASESTLPGVATSTPAAPTPTDPATSGPPYDSADAAKARFDSVNQALVAENPKADGRDVIDNLVAAGFTKTDMELTKDKTAIGLKAESIQFSVKFGTGCVIGQIGSWGYSSELATVTQTGTCLVGKTRAIDW